MDAFEIARMFFALLAVLALIGLLGFAAKKAGLQNGASPLGRKRRLSLVESLALDNKRRAAILRCDGLDHLVILGPASEAVISSAPSPVEAVAGPTPAARPFNILQARVWRDTAAADAA